MKESELITMRNKIASLSRLVEFILKELENTRTLSVGTYQTVREMPGYDEAIKIMTEKAKVEESDEEPLLDIDPEI